MSVVLFYGKPGCTNNVRQRRLLAAAGHEVVDRDLLAEPWTKARLAAFFVGLPVDQWFNPAAPAVRSGKIATQLLTPAQALELLIRDPLLIRRPLMEVQGETLVGFDPRRVHAWIGLGAAPPGEDLETCRRAAHASCTGPEASP